MLARAAPLEFSWVRGPWAKHQRQELVTDLIAEKAFLGDNDGVYPVLDAYLCISLTEPFDGDGKCHKLVATIFTEEPL